MNLTDRSCQREEVQTTFTAIDGGSRAKCANGIPCRTIQKQLHFRSVRGQSITKGSKATPGSRERARSFSNESPPRRNREHPYSTALSKILGEDHALHRASCSLQLSTVCPDAAGYWSHACDEHEACHTQRSLFGRVGTARARYLYTVWSFALGKNNGQDRADTDLSYPFH